MKDLHIHTKYSDGEYDEYEILNKIKEAGIKEFAICDHDNIEGSQKVYELLKKENSSLIFHTGIELSCTIPNFKNKQIDIHLLIRDFDYKDNTILNLIKQISNLRKQKIERMTNLVKEIYNINIKEDEINEVLKNTNSIGKPHIFQVLSKYGNYDMEQYYKNMRNLKSSDLKLNALDVISKMKVSKGYVTLAHPIEIMEEYNFDYNDIDELIAYLSSKGLDGLETKHSKHTKENYTIFSKIAKKYNLIETQGSDYHGPNVKPKVKLGICKKED